MENVRENINKNIALFDSYINCLTPRVTRIIIL